MTTVNERFLTSTSENTQKPLQMDTGASMIIEEPYIWRRKHEKMDVTDNDNPPYRL